MRLLPYPFFLALALIFTFSRCGSKEEPIEVDPAFAEYVSAFTSGEISIHAPVRIVFRDAIHEELRNKNTPEKLLDFKPSIKGKAEWRDSQTLVFTPEKPMKQNQLYEVHFSLGKVMEVPKELNTFSFSFHTIKQDFHLESDGLTSLSDNDLTWQQYRGSLYAADKVETEALTNLVAAQLGGKSQKIKWETEGLQRQHNFVIDSIQRMEDARELRIEWDGKPIGAEAKGNFTYEIPALGDFKILDIKVVQHPEQFVSIRFSDPLDRDQNLIGLAVLAGRTRDKTQISRNELRIYPSSRLSGNQNLTIAEGLKNVMGYRLKESQNFDVTFEELKPAVRLVGKGNILPSTDGLVFPFEAVNLSAVDVRIIQIFEQNVSQFLQTNHYDGQNQLKRVGRLVKKKTVALDGDRLLDLGRWQRFHLDLNDLIKTEPGAIYRIELGFRKSHSLYSCNNQGLEEDEDAFSNEDEDWESEPESSNWDYINDYYYDYYYNEDYTDYNYRERDNPCHNSYYVNKRIARNILATDLGVIAKMGSDSEMRVFVTHLGTTEPQANVQVELLNFQQQVIAKGKTDNQGMVKFKKTDTKPFLLVAKHDKQRGYLRLDDGSALSTSRFDVAGQVVQEGIKGYLYGERGVWRPGDTLFLTFILEDKDKLLPANHPVTFELFNARGQLAHRAVSTRSVKGFYNFTMLTQKDDPTGNWRARIKVGGAEFQRYLRVENIKPNRLKIYIDFGKETLSAKAGKIEGELYSEWLHGAKARNLKAHMAMKLTQSKTKFDRYPNHNFDDPVRSFSADETVVFEGRLNDEGKANISMNVTGGQEAPGMLRANFITRVFEEGGDFSIDRFALTYAPFERFIGVRVPEGDKRGMLLTDTTHTIDIISLNAEGKPVPAANLEVKLYKVQWRWWWERTDDNLANYIGRSSTTPLKSETVSTNNKGVGRFTFKIKYPDWGRYLVRVVDKNGGHATGQPFYVDWPGWAGRGKRENPDGATMLVFSSSKDKYKVGEEAEITVPTTENARALFTVENGKKVIEARWVETQKDETKIRFKVTPEMAPNVYASLTVIQPHSQTANDLPMRMYGTLPLMVEDPATHLTPIIDGPEKMAPEKSFTYKVSEKDKKAMTYTLAVVDEGLLDLTRFKTPDPWSQFYAREALGVKTWDYYDEIIGAYGANLERLLSIGGDGELSAKDDSKLNRFKPMVKFLGPFHLDGGKTNSHKIDVPNYIGSVRVMVIAGHNGAYGHAEKTVPVRSPLMVLATLPRVLGPDETMKLPVNLFAMEKHVKDVTVMVETNNMLTLTGESQKSVTFKDVGDQVVNFDLKVAKRIGAAKVKIIAKSGNETASYEVDLEVRNANPYITDVREIVIEPGQTWSEPFEPVGMAGTNTGFIELSAIPPVDFGRRLQYLTSYPHGCLEQTTSGAFPQLFLTDVMELDGGMKDRIRGNVNAAIARISSFQLSGGGLAYWPGQPNVNDWSTSYAGHFMLEAEKKGYNLPYGFKDKWISHQRNIARSWTSANPNHADYYKIQDLPQAYRLYTLALAGSPELGAMNRLRESGSMSLQARWRLAAAYILAGKPEVAQSLINTSQTEIEPYTQMGHTYGSHHRDNAMMIETLVLMGEKSKAAQMVRNLAQELNADAWMSTQTTAYSLLAISKYLGDASTGNSLDYAITLGGKSDKRQTTKPLARHDIPVKGNSKVAMELRNNSKSTLFARIISTGQPLAGTEQAKQNRLNMTVKFTDLTGKEISTSELRQGADFLAVVTVSNPGLENLKDMALTQVFPSGWEIHNTRMDSESGANTTSAATYQDIKDDRVNTYFDLRKGETKTFKILLNAAYQGRYYLPTVSCEAMYDNSIYARTTGMWVEVKL